MLLVPAVLMAVPLVARNAPLRRGVTQAWVAGLVSTALYDLFRFGFIWLGLISGDPIPHIGAALGLHPDWLFGYIWRYAGNGAGLAVAFHALGYRGTRAGVLYGLFVCGGLLVTLTVAPYGQQMLFPLTFTTVVMATGGHVIYGAVLGSQPGNTEGGQGDQGDGQEPGAGQPQECRRVPCPWRGSMRSRPAWFGCNTACVRSGLTPRPSPASERSPRSRRMNLP